MISTLASNAFFTRLQPQWIGASQAAGSGIETGLATQEAMGRRPICEFIALTSSRLPQELRDVLTREQNQFQLSEEQAESVIEMVRETTEIVEPQSEVTVCRDDQDNRVLECAVDGHADYIVTGDNDLLDLESFRQIEIITVADMLCQLRNQGDG